MRKELDFWKNKVSKLEEECYEKQNEIEELNSDNEELKSDNENLKNEIAKLKQHLKSKENLYENEEIPFADEQYEEDLLAELQDRHQQDCITINQLNVTIDVLLDKMERLRNNKSMVLKCLSNFTE